MTTQTLTLAEFLLARIAEDEYDARLAFGDHNDNGPEWTEIWSGTVDLGCQPPAYQHLLGCDDAGVSRHIVNFDPARVLAECGAKRRIVDLHQRLTTGAGGAYCPLCDAYEVAEGVWSGRGDLWPCPTLLALAQPYADHEAFRQEWRADA